MSQAEALVQTGPRMLEAQKFPIPKDLPPGGAIVRVEANGLCHSDVDAYEGTDQRNGGRPSDYPRILGHEIVGVIEDINKTNGLRASFNAGDRVGVNPINGCDNCEYCLDGKRAHCTGWGTANNIYGYIPTSHESGLWGGYATHVYVHPNTILYQFPHHISPLDATQWNALAGGIQWGVMNPNLQKGDVVAILGSGQRGLAAVIAMKAAGAKSILVTGITQDAHKLRLAKRFGADVTVNVQEQDLTEVADEFTQGRGFDVVLDTTPVSVEPVVSAIEILRPGGKLVTVGLKTQKIDGFPIDRVTTKGIHVIGSLGQTHEAYKQAAELIATQEHPISEMRTHVFGLDELGTAIATLKGDIPGENAINVVVTPGKWH